MYMGKCKKKRVIVNNYQYGVVDKQKDMETVNEIMFQPIPPKNSEDNPLRPIKKFLEMLELDDFYEKWEPRVQISDLQKYLKDIFANTAFFTRPDSLHALLFTLNKITTFLDERQTKEIISEILRLTDKLQEQIGTGSPVYKIVSRFQRLHSAYESFGETDSLVTSLYTRNHTIQSADDLYLNNGVISQYYGKLIDLIKSRTLTVKQINRMSLEELINIINQSQGVFPLHAQTTSACRKLLRLGVKRSHVNNLTDVMASITHEINQTPQPSKKGGIIG